MDNFFYFYFLFFSIISFFLVFHSSCVRYEHDTKINGTLDKKKKIPFYKYYSVFFGCHIIIG